MTEHAPLDTRIEGTPADVHLVADWLLSAAEAFDEAAMLISSSREIAVDWQGLAAWAYEDQAYPMRQAAVEWQKHAVKLGERLRAYADELYDRQKDMSDHRWTAREAGLRVVDFTIFPPDPLEEVPAYSQGMSSEEKTARSAALARNATLRDQWRTWSYLCEDVPRTRRLFTDFVEDVALAVNELIELPGIEEVTAGILTNVTSELPNSYFTQKSAFLQAAATAAAVRNTNEWRRLGLSPAAAATKGSASRAAKTLTARSASAANYAKWAGRAGVVTSFVAAGVEIASGESPGSTTVGLAGGFIGASLAAPVAAAAVAGMTGIGAIIIPAVGVSLAAAGGTALAKVSYEYFIPLHIRRKFVDEPLHDFMDSVQDFNRTSDDGRHFSEKVPERGFLSNPGGAL